MSILAHNHDLEWQAFRDEETYHALRDGPRQYAAVWVIERMRKYLPSEHVALAHQLHAMARSLECGASGGAYERVDKTPASSHEALLTGIARIQELTGYEHAAKTRVGADGRLCFLGVIGGDGQAELARRVKYPPDSHRSLRKLVQITLEALSEYRDENDACACRKITP